MKIRFKIGLILLMNIFLFNDLYSQISLLVSPTIYKQSGEISYTNIENRVAPDFGILYGIPLSDNFTLQVGFSKSERISDIKYEFGSGKVDENFVNVPVLIAFTKPMKENLLMVLGFGPNMTTIYNQKLTFIENTIIPGNFKTEYGYSSYYKFGFVTNFGFKHKINSRSSFLYTLSSQYEFKDLVLNKGNNPAFFYKTLSLNLGLEFRLKK